MKKKVLAVSLIVALLAIAVVSTSLAWFTDTDEVVNKFTVGDIEIEQKEDFEQGSELLPVIGTDPTDDDDNYVKKNVKVENTGKNDAYVQTYIAIPADLDNHGVMKMWGGDFSEFGWKKMDGDTTTAVIEPYIMNVTIPGESYPYNLYLCRWTQVLPVGQETTACLEYVYITPETDMNTYDLDGDGVIDTGYFVINGVELTAIDALDGINVYVATQGVQAQGFDNCDQALDSAFGTKHPWAE